MRTQIYQILYSDSRPLTHNVVKALILLSVAAVVAIAMIKTLPRFDLVADAIMNTVRMAAMAVLTIELVARFWVAPEGAAHAFENAIPDAARKRRGFRFQISLSSLVTWPCGFTGGAACLG